MTGKTQSYARVLNNRLVMRELRAENCSATMLSKRLGLSNAALSAIVDELKKKGYIKEVEAPAQSGLGRRPVYYTVNENFGCIAVVSLADYEARVVISDMKMNITDSVETRVEHYDVAALYELILTLKNLLAMPKYRDIPLLGIDLSIPGRIKTTTGELQLLPQFDKDIYSEKNHVVNLFKRQFGVPVVMTNDINLAALGEMHCGSLKDVENGMLVHVDEGIGGAFIIGKKLFNGSTGFAGEIGLMHHRFGGKTDVIDEFVSLRAIKNKLSAQYGKKLHTSDVVALYNTEPEVKKYVLSTARCLGEVLKDVEELLDVPNVLLSGRVTLFGEDYINTINKELEKSINNAVVNASLLGRDAPVIGAIFKAVDALTDDILE